MIISHRGFWTDELEKNSIWAFEKSFLEGFGTETDIRDFHGELVISHDMPTKDSLSLNSFFEIYNSINNNLPLALNIKSDGLQGKLLSSLKHYNINNYFVFDMSTPDAINYLNHGINSYTRESEYEKIPVLYNESKGVWMDEFKENWITLDKISSHLDNKKEVCIVSPELHRREYKGVWNMYKKGINFKDSKLVHLCTDYPLIAKEFFK